MTGKAGAKRGRKAARGKGFVAKDVPLPPGLDAEEAEEFARVVEAVRAIGTLGRCDIRLIEATARTSVLIRRAYAELAQAKPATDGDTSRDAAEGIYRLTLRAANGTPMPHPMIGVINSQTMRLRGLLADLGLSPKTAKLGGGPESKPDAKWEGILGVVAG